MNCKKIIAALLAGLLALCCASCGDEETTAAQTQDAAVDKTPVIIESVTDYAGTAMEKADALTPTPASDFEIETAEDGVTVLFYRGTADDVRVPDTIDGLPVTQIADGAFRDQTDLTSVIFPESLKVLGKEILAGCTALEYLETPLLGKDADAEGFLGYLFGAESAQNYSKDIPPESLAVVRINGSMTRLSELAFYDCNDLRAVVLPDTVREIGKFAFYNCASMVQVMGLDHVKSYGDYAFSDCAALTAISLGSEAEAIGFGALYNCRSLVSVTLPFAGGSETENNYLAYIFGAEAPDFSTGFYPPKLSRVEITEGCKTLGNCAFYECESLKEIILPETLERIGVRAFYECTSLWSIRLPDSLKQIDANAFWGCDSLSDIIFGKNLSSIGINAFYNCDSLTVVQLPSSLKKLPASCFAGCIALRSIDLGGVTEVGAQAFRNCKSVKTVKCQSGITFGEGNDTVKSIVEQK